MILVGVEVGRDDHAVAELAPSQCLLGFLAIRDAVKLDEYLYTKFIIGINNYTKYNLMTT